VLYQEPTANPFAGYSPGSRAISLDPPAKKKTNSDQKPTTARIKKIQGNAKVSGMNYSTSTLAPDAQAESIINGYKKAQ